MTMQQNRARMPGPLLCSGRLGDFRPLGAQGRTVLSAALQIRAGIRRRIDARAAEMLAIPQVSEAGDTVDWYAPIPGPVVPWSAGSDEERRAGTIAAKDFRSRLAAQSRSLLAGNPRGDDEVFARLLPLAAMIPSDAFIHLVDGRPVLTYWGFHPLDAGPDLDVVRDLPMAAGTAPPATPSAAPPPLAAVPTVEPRRPWWRWLAWLLGLVLALLLLLLLLRGCGVALPGVPGLDLPQVEFRVPDALSPDIPSPVVLVPPPPAVAGTQPGAGVLVLPGDGSAVPAPDAVPVPAVEEAGMHSAPAPGPDAPALGGSGPQEPVPPPPGPDGPVEATTRPGPPPTAEVPPAPGLTIPESAVSGGTVDFLNGRWRSRTSLMDSRTGLPLEVEYEFQDGAGTSTIRRSDGVACEAPTQARMTGGTLELVQTGPAACPDGTAFDASRVECTPDQTGRARCRGIHGTGEGFLVDIVQ